MNQGFWMTKGSGGFSDGEVSYDNSSRAETKRPHQWFVDAPEADLFPNKKQVVEVPNNNLFSGMLHSNIPAWENATGFHSVPSHFTGKLFDSDTARSADFHDRNVQSISPEKANPGRSSNEDLFGGDPSFALSMSHTLEDPRSAVNYGGIRKVKVSQVKDSDNVISSPTGHTYDRVDHSFMSVPRPYKVDDNSVAMGLAYNKGDENVMSFTETYDRENNIFISMGQPYNKGDDSISISSYKENNSGVARGHTFSKVENNIVSTGHTYNKPDESSSFVGNIYSREEGQPMPRDNMYNRGDNNLTIGQSYSKGQSTIISFGGSHNDDADTSNRMLPSYEFLMGQSSSQRSETPNDDGLGEPNTGPLGAQATISSNEVSKKREETKASKKVAPTTFPSNVRSLLSTGMLDGVQVKYIAWSREKELRGVIKGSGYQCGCQLCNFSKVVNAYEFERHAGCKTKHPNNHIYFENGKTIYGIVQELRSTPQNLLFDVIQTITGSPINQKSFRLWKESFLAATRELQRIYGKDGGNQLL